MHVQLHIQNPKLNFLFRFRFLRASPRIRVRVFRAVCVKVFLVPRPSKDLLLIIRLTSFLSSPQLWYGRLQVKISWYKMSCSHGLQILRKRSSFSSIRWMELYQVGIESLMCFLPMWKLRKLLSTWWCRVLLFAPAGRVQMQIVKRESHCCWFFV